MEEEKVAILDAGAQYGKVIDRRCHELGVKSELLPLNISATELASKKYQAIIISGSSNSVYQKDSLKCDPQIFSLGIPVLGICYGMHLINFFHGGKVAPASLREDGQCLIEINNKYQIFSGLKEKEQVLMSHGDSVVAKNLAPGFEITATSGELVAGMANPSKKIYALQFHPEVDLTINGKKIFKNFLYDIVGLKGTYTVDNRQQQAIEYIKKTVGSKKVIVLVSGGVDSTVCAVLLTQAINPKDIYAIHVDSGFMRQNESDQVEKTLKQAGINVKVINAQDTFYNATFKKDDRLVGPLNQVTNPEDKRLIIGNTFMRIADQAVKDLNLDFNDIVLAQGTLRPDLIESASETVSQNAAVIKTHHNDTSEVRKLRQQGKVVEPLRDYHKDEVRALGTKLGISDSLVWRQPFPGPGLAIRIICADKPYITDDFGKINQSLQEFYTKDLSVTLLPVQTVGVQGDGRSYSYLAGISGKADWKKLFSLAKEIPKKIRQINRVVYIFGKPITQPVTQITPTYLTPDVITQLQSADALVTEFLIKNNLIKKLSQVPVISLPVNFGIEGNRSIAIRPFITNDFMTGQPAVPGVDISKDLLDKLVKDILEKVPSISRILYDLTSKPPATTEWE